MLDLAPLALKHASGRETLESKHLNEKAARSSKELETRYADTIVVDHRLSRKLVSFQANKRLPVHRWYKFKEGFSAELVSLFLREQALPPGPILDPFAGSGTTLAICAELGRGSTAIELLPIGQTLVETRIAVQRGVPQSVLERIRFWISERPWQDISNPRPLPKLNITADAYSMSNELQIRRYLTALDDEPASSRLFLRLALLAVLESVSFTRKDGQYLRWDRRSSRSGLKSNFHKGEIESFGVAIGSKLDEIYADLSALSPVDLRTEDLVLLPGSCLRILPTLKSSSFSGVFTSPPYCNRYDYTRTYALEHALLDVGEMDTKALRQDMLTCTVENRVKDLIAMNPLWENVMNSTTSITALRDILAALRSQAKERALNNVHIVRMVDGYFLEMACVVFELHRVLVPGGKIVMVNDNVRYGGLNIPVDCILSEVAAAVGLRVNQVLALPRGKGNSSQQMGLHGREEVRKSVYLWEKV